MQTSINRFTVKLSGGAGAMEREDELALKRETEYWKFKLGIQWPRPTNKVGRPSRQLQFEQAIYKE
eukprot:736370-Amphidinium_carterae.1